MNASPPRTPRATRAAAGGVVLALAATSVSAGTNEPAPAGIPAGRWILAPYLVASAGADDNLFQESDADGPESDTISTFRAGLVARLPVRMSLLELGYEAEKVHYSTHSFQRDLVQRGAALGRFTFSTGDELVLSDVYTSGFSDILAINPGGELVFLGEPYNLNDADIVLRRQGQLRAGYEVQLSRVDLSFSGTDPVPYYDYHGWEWSAEFRQPSGLNRWMTFNYAGLRFDHFEANDPDASEPFRRESGDALGVGFRGTLAGGSPYTVKLAYSRYTLDGATSSSLNALVANGEIALPVGPRTSVRLNLSRRPYASTYDTYYMTNYVRATAERVFRLSRVGIQAAFSYNAYGGPLLDPETGTPATSCGLETRRDTYVGVGSFFDWLLHPRLALRVAADHQTREASCGGGDYDATEVFTGIRFGWF